MKRIFTLLIALLVFTPVLAQEREFMLIEKSDGTILEINIKDIQRFYFEQRPIVISPEIGGKRAEAVDLGLSVKWASWDMGVMSAEETGKKFYQGDIVGNMNKKTAQTLPLPWNFCGSELDIATTNWGDEWRLPNAVDWKELFEKCSWEIIRDIDYPEMTLNPNFTYVIKATGPNGNSITFPIIANNDYISTSHESWPQGYIERGGGDSYMCGNNIYCADVSAYWQYYGNLEGGPIEEVTLNEGLSLGKNKVHKEYSHYDFSYVVRPVNGESTKEYFKLYCVASLKNEVYISCAFRMEGHEAFKDIKEYGLCYSTTDEAPTIETGEKVILDNINEYYTEADSLLGPLTDETTYHIRAYAKIDGSVYYSTTNSITTAKALPVFTDITQGEVVDLGLHTKWATCNLGATSPYEKGSAVTWQDDVRSQWGVSVESIYATEHDYAHQQLGEAWRMPTATELCELRDSCEWTMGFYSDVLGYKVAGKNGNSIFLPYKMHLLSGSCATRQEYYTYNDTKKQQNLMTISVAGDKDCYIRPVQGEPYVVFSDLKANYDTHDYRHDVNYCNFRVAISAFGLDESKTERRLGVCYGTTPNITFSESNFVETDNPISGREYIVKINNLQYSTTYYYRGVAIIDGKIYYDTEGKVTTGKPDKQFYPGDIPEAVDLGLSVKWSSWNFSANKPSDKGLRYNLFASFEGQWQNYHWLTDIYSQQIWDNPHLYDNVTEDDEDLVDYIWGNGWRIPTKDEWLELIDQCTWKETTIDNVEGYQVTGKNGNSIFLPYCGHLSGYKDDYIYDNNSCTDYWTATKYQRESNYPSCDYYFFGMFDSEHPLGDCWMGNYMWIRPVKQ